MKTLMSQIRTAAARRAQYKRTRAELSRMPLDVALDLEIDRDDSTRLARQAVYGG